MNVTSYNKDERSKLLKFIVEVEIGVKDFSNLAHMALREAIVPRNFDLDRESGILNTILILSWALCKIPFTFIEVELTRNEDRGRRIRPDAAVLAADLLIENNSKWYKVFQPSVTTGFDQDLSWMVRGIKVIECKRLKSFIEFHRNSLLRLRAYAPQRIARQLAKYVDEFKGLVPVILATAHYQGCRPPAEVVQAVDKLMDLVIDALKLYYNYRYSYDINIGYILISSNTKFAHFCNNLNLLAKNIIYKVNTDQLVREYNMRVGEESLARLLGKVKEWMRQVRMNIRRPLEIANTMFLTQPSCYPVVLTGETGGKLRPIIVIRSKPEY